MKVDVDAFFMKIGKIIAILPKKEEKTLVSALRIVRRALGIDSEPKLLIGVIYEGEEPKIRFTSTLTYRELVSLHRQIGETISDSNLIDEWPDITVKTSPYDVNEPIEIRSIANSVSALLVDADLAVESADKLLESLNNVVAIDSVKNGDSDRS